jgi:hypothetical protein
MPPRRRILPATALLAFALALPSSAFGQATRTWVSGVGDDANPCSRTAPCKTFAGAISKTANAGEINVIDPGGFGGVTITKSLTIRGRGPTAGALVAGTNAIVINATATDKVTIQGLDIIGTGVGAPTALSGIKVLSAGRVNIVDNQISKFKAGVVVAPTSATTRVVLKDNHIYDNDLGVVTAPGNNTITQAITTMRWNTINDNVCGVSAGGFGTNASTPTTTDCGLNSVASGINKTAAARMWHNGIHDNQFGVFVRGANGFADLGFNEVSGNTTFGLRRIEGGLIRSTSPATNLFSNAADDTPTSTIPLG